MVVKIDIFQFANRIWWVVGEANTYLVFGMGSCTSADQAVRNARNFLKRNQNEVYK